ncbi:hypothetical protein NQD34_000133 [Periophthalmus magnuspinnatus]|nr:hypothetical protein NQD34_000133 [Periophthalmus magnuspinnatus]
MRRGEKRRRALTHSLFTVRHDQPTSQGHLYRNQSTIHMYSLHSLFPPGINTSSQWLPYLNYCRASSNSSITVLRSELWLQFIHTKGNIGFQQQTLALSPLITVRPIDKELKEAS